MKLNPGGGFDTAHRNTYPAHIQQAMRVLDRVAGGEEAHAFEVRRALMATGDLEPIYLSPAERSPRFAMHQPRS